MRAELEGAVVRERKFMRTHVYQDRYSRWADPAVWLTYFCNGHVVTYGELTVAGKTYDVTLINGNEVARDEWYAGEITVRASEAFALATGLYPHEFEALCDELDRRAREAIDAGDDNARGVTGIVVAR